ncbi:site-specific DNA-methyltransferase (plasmid) [Streptomyces platensis]|uniref:DNA-methyltransferase n=1 Tax=Streptomyces platensis TaxID=58346 RepID=UPI002ED52EBB|nr:site-specific DNA-methyltransferase [Streptomyces platensis]
MTQPYYRDEQVTLHLGDSLDVLATLPDASVDAVVTDPPYEVGIGGQAWDSTGIAYSVPMWTECLRVLKPGGHLISFGAPRTYHRMVVAAEDAGFRVIDQLDWIYTHGKPKGSDLARAIDRHRDDRSDVLRVTAWLAAARDAAGWTNARIDELFGFSGMGGLWTTQGKAAIVPKSEQWDLLREALGFDDAEILPTVTLLNDRKRTAGEAWGQREVIGQRSGTKRDGGRLYGAFSGDSQITAPHSEQAKQWEGWNTALKPAHDPILLARKSTGYDSLVGGLLRHGVGGLNVAGCPAAGGGWPTNILLGHDCPDLCEPGCPVREMRQSAHSFPIFRLNSRTPAAERIEVDGVKHETPKPLDLIRWLVRLVTPPGGTVLDPFAGSGTTLEAAALEAFNAVGIERHEPYARIARVRVEQPRMQSLFGEIA